MRALVLPMLAVLLGGGGCGETRAPGVTRTDSAGVQMVHGSADLPDLAWRADTILVFGGATDGPASFYRVRRALIDVDDRGVVYVLDPSTHRVVAYTPEGRALRAWGRSGEGPGELEFPLSVTVDPDGDVLVHEASRGALVRYAPSGDLRGEQPAPRVIATRLRHVEAVPEGILSWEREPYQGSDERTDRLVLRTAGRDRPLIEGRPSHSSTAHWPACGMTFTTPLPLSPRIHWTEWGGRVAVAAWADLRVDVFEDGRLARTTTIGSPVQPVDAGAAARLLDLMEVRGPCDSSPSDYVERHGFHPWPQGVHSLTMGPEGELWIEAQAPENGRRIVVLDPSGAPIGALPATFPMPLTFLPDGRAVVQIVDTFDVERVGIVQIRDGHAGHGRSVTDRRGGPERNP